MKGCTDKRIGRWIGSYEFNALEDDERRVFLDHLIECEYCYDQVYSVEPVMAEFRNHRAAAQRGETFRHSASRERSAPAPGPFRIWGLIPTMAALTLLIGLGVYVLYIPRQNQQAESVKVAGVDSPWKEIEIPKAAYVRPSEPIVLRKNNKAFDHAMTAYQENDYPAAIEQLEALSELEPDGEAEVKFYLGVSLLLVDRGQDAIPPLRQSVQSSAGPLSESSHYYLALAYLKSNQPQQALTELDATIGMNGEHRPSAESLKEQVSSLIRYF
jgi:Tetratricopeptide repeat